MVGREEGRSVKEDCSSPVVGDAVVTRDGSPECRLLGEAEGRINSEAELVGRDVRRPPAGARGRGADGSLDGSWLGRCEVPANPPTGRPLGGNEGRATVGEEDDSNDGLVELTLVGEMELLIDGDVLGLSVS